MTSTRTPRGDLALGAAGVMGVAVGVLVGVAPGRWDAVFFLVTAVAVIAAVGALLRGPAPPRPPRPRLNGRQVLALVALYLVLASTLVIRQRSADELASDPLDLAGQFRVITLVGAFAFACVSMLTRRFTTRGIPTAGWLMIAYVAVVPLGAIDAVSPSLVMFKWVELVTFVVVWLALTRAFPGDVATPLRHFGIFMGLILAAVLAGIALFPDYALSPVDGALPFQVRGHLPQLSANDVGTLGLIVFAFGIGRTRPNAGLVAGGAAIVVAAQFRTGYVAMLAMVVVVLVLRRQTSARLLLVVLAVALPLAAQTSVIEQTWLRGEASSESLSTLTGRTVWWGEAIDVADRSPVVGLGLSSGVRFEVLQARFNGLTSTIHSTWVEAYVGAGLIGVTLVALAFVAALWSAFRRVLHDGNLLPAAVLTMFAVKSITGSSIEIGGQLLMLFLLIASAAAERPLRSAPADTRLELEPAAGR